MAIDIERLIGKALGEAVGRALHRTIRAKAEAIFAEALGSDSPFGKRRESKIEAGLQRLLIQPLPGDSL